MKSPASSLALPNVLVVGPMKAGTTWLHSYLSDRGDICLPDGVKETFFFDRNSDKDLAWYASHFKHFDPRSHEKIVEVGASYFPEAQAPYRVKSLLGDVTILILVRDPVERAWSHYNHLRRMGYTRLPLDQAVRTFPQIIEASRYRLGIERWKAAISPEQVKVLRFELIRQDPTRFLQDVCSALNLAFKPISDNAHLERNEAAQSRSMWLARGARTVANRLRSHQMYSVVNAVKGLGAKRLIFGKPASSGNKISEGDRGLLAGLLRTDIEALENFDTQEVRS